MVGDSMSGRPEWVDTDRCSQCQGRLVGFFVHHEKDCPKYVPSNSVATVVDRELRYVEPPSTGDLDELRARIDEIERALKLLMDGKVTAVYHGKERVL